MKKILELTAIIASIGLLFLIVNFIHFRWIPVSVILWSCLADLLVALVITLPAAWIIIRRRNVVTREEFALAAMFASTLVVLYSVMGPTVIDRSLSIYIVQKVDQRGGAISASALGDIFVEEYMPEFRLVDVRLTEQLDSGTLVEDGGCLVLTPKGRLLSHFAGVYRKNFLPRKRRLLDDVTDQLTRPFDNTTQKVDVSCERAPT